MIIEITTEATDPAAIAAAIERAGIILLRDHLGCYYTIEPRKGLAHLSAERFLTWLPQHTGIALTPDTPATARRILASAELAAISTPCEPILPLTPAQLEDLVRAIYNKLCPLTMSTASPLTAPTTEQVSGFTLHIEHVPASLSHRELHRPMPIFDIIGAVRDGKQTCINQESISLMAILIEHLEKPAFNHTTQHRFLILAQSRKLALSILHGNAFCTQLHAHFKPITGTAHQPKDDAQPCHASVFLCYPAQEEPLCPHMMQQDQRQTNRPDIMAHIFTPEEVTHLIQHFPSIHTPTA